MNLSESSRLLTALAKRSSLEPLDIGPDPGAFAAARIESRIVYRASGSSRQKYAPAPTDGAF